VWLVSRYDDVRAVLGDAERFSNDFSNLTGEGGATDQEDPGGLGFADPPNHTRLRRLLTPEFTVRRLRRLEPRIAEMVDDHLEAMARAGAPADLVSSFAVPIPSLVVSELLGVGADEREELQRISGARFVFADDAETALTAVNDSVAYLTEVVARQRKEPGDGLLGALLTEHGDAVSDRELAGLADGLITGGHDTTASMFALGTVLLLKHPEYAGVLRAQTGDGEVRDDEAGRVIEEMLRYLTVVQVAFPRFAKEDVEIGGQRIAAGEMVICSLVAANRDPALGPNMDSFDPSREVPPNATFGHGIHHCLGAQLARTEMRIAYPRLLRRFPGLRVAVPDDEIAYRELSIVHGVTNLPVAW
jgi:cytochrome P450